jgi:hypothetical protein
MIADFNLRLTARISKPLDQTLLLINLAQFLLQLRDQPAYALRSFIVRRGHLSRKQAVFHDLHFEFYSVIFVSHRTHGLRPFDPSHPRDNLKEKTSIDSGQNRSRSDFIFEADGLTSLCSLPALYRLPAQRQE